MTPLALLLKALTTAFVVVSAALVAERTRPFLAAMVLSLPVVAGPAYVMLALDHGAPFIAAASLASLVANASIVPAVVGYALAARRGASMPVSLAALIGPWIAMAAITGAFRWSLASALVLNAVAFAIGIAATWRWRRVAAAGLPVRRWYDIPLRALVVVSVVVAVVVVSERLGPSVTGAAALFPASFGSFVILMQGRLGGPVVASALVNGLVMLIGFTGFVAAIHLFALHGLVWTGIAAALAIPAIWSALVWTVSRLRP